MRVAKYLFWDLKNLDSDIICLLQLALVLIRPFHFFSHSVEVDLSRKRYGEARERTKRG